MSEISVSRSGDQPPGAPPSPEEQHRQPPNDQSGAPQPWPSVPVATGAEELAVALDHPATMAARMEYDDDGQPLVRIFDRQHGETIAVLTPEELRALTEQTGLPPGMFIETAT